MILAFFSVGARDLAALYNYLAYAKTETGNTFLSVYSTQDPDSNLTYYKTRIKSNRIDIDTNHYQISIAAFGWYNIAAPLSN